MADACFSFDGAPVPARPGQSLAAALTAAGHRAFRETAQGARRGIFCGMGVCQDCLVTVDGQPNRRACMTAAEAGLLVKTQVALPRLDLQAPPPASPPARIEAPDVLIVGGGAGGLSAAIAARAAGASVLVLDERKVGGGQYFKQAAAADPLDAQQRQGRALLEEAQASGAEILGGVEIWGAFDGPLFLAEWRGGALVVRPRAAIIATGAYERPVIVPGWTLPGVMTTGAAQTLWRSYRTLPGRRVAVCGSGPLNLQVALELARGGAEVALVAEAAPAPWAQPRAAMALAAAGPRLAGAGFGLLRGLRGAGVPMRFTTRLTGVEARDGALRATFRSRAGDETTADVDALCMNGGFEPQNEILRLLGAEMRYDPAFGHLRCTRDAGMATTLPGLYAVGDCAGLGGAPAAMVEGRIAGRAAAAFVRGRPAGADPHEARALQRHRRFQACLWRLYEPFPGTPHDQPDDTLLCRCEEITLGQMRAGLDDRTGHVGTLKRATRVGMGRCQGRYCGPVAARMVAARTGRAIEDLSHFAPRVPIKPVSIAAILAAQEALDGTP